MGGIRSQNLPFPVRTAQGMADFYALSWPDRAGHLLTMVLAAVWQVSAGHLHRSGFDSCHIEKKKDTPDGMSSCLEQGTGIEPASVAWEATILPMN